jgi:hypothetical protein
MRVANDILIPELARLLKEEKEVRFTPSGNSMRPFIEGEKDSVVLAPLNRSPRKGDILLAQVHIADKIAYVLHRVLRVEENEQQTIFVLQGDGNLQGEERCTRAEIIGIVKRIEYPSGRRKMHTSACLWQRLIPIRRYLLKIYRHTWLKWCY